MKEDIISVEILPDGTIKTETDGVSMPNHQSAEKFLKEMFRLAGGKTTMKFKKGLRVTEAGEHHHHHQ